MDREAWRATVHGGHKESAKARHLAIQPAKGIKGLKTRANQAKLVILLLKREGKPGTPWSGAGGASDVFSPFTQQIEGPHLAAKRGRPPSLQDEAAILASIL